MSFPFSTNDARKLINQVQRSARHDLNYQFVIAPIAENGAIGMIGLNNMNWTDKNGELEYWLGKPFWERGYASDALGSLLQFAFQVLLLHRVYAITAAPNEPSWRLLERHGFVREATWRRASMIDGRWHDVYGYGLLEKEYASVRELGDK
jgi:RimJ/RimL family protein N-acetyltransferase